MRSLEAVRNDFDAVDLALIALIAQRQRLAAEAGAIKRARGLPVVDLAREAQQRQTRAERAAAEGVDADVIESVFSALVVASRKKQE